MEVVRPIGRGFNDAELILFHNLAAEYGLMPHEVANCVKDVPGVPWLTSDFCLDVLCLEAHARAVDAARDKAVREAQGG